MMFDDALRARAESILALYRAKGWMIATAESCTGGLVAALLTEIAGSSDVVDRAAVVYSNEAKADMLGVSPALILGHGAVSQSVARAMAEGLLARSRAMVTLSITGIAGPGGGSEAKPVGLVHFACAVKREGTEHVERRFGDLGRAGVRRAALEQALDLLERAAA